MSLSSILYPNIFLAYYCSLGPPECSVTVCVSAETDMSVTVTFEWANCLDAQPRNVSLRWCRKEDPYNFTGRYISSQNPYIITGLEPNTSYSIMVHFCDACGSISDMADAVTKPRTSKCKRS